jgi:hypothetical protein
MDDPVPNRVQFVDAMVGETVGKCDQGSGYIV